MSCDIGEDQQRTCGQIEPSPNGDHVQYVKILVCGSALVESKDERIGDGPQQEGQTRNHLQVCRIEGEPEAPDASQPPDRIRLGTD